MTAESRCMSSKEQLQEDRSGGAGIGRTVPPLSERLSFSIHQLSAQLVRIVNPLFRRFGIDSVSSQIMLLVQERGAMGISELLDIMHLPQSTISHQLQRLEKRGYLLRERLGRDQRNVTISLTQSGNRVASECEEISASAYNAMLGGLQNISADDMRSELNSLLAQLTRMKASNPTKQSAE